MADRAVARVTFVDGGAAAPGSERAVYYSRPLAALTEITAARIGPAQGV